jgi:hypothetical protein
MKYKLKYFKKSNIEWSIEYSTLIGIDQGGKRIRQNGFTPSLKDLNNYSKSLRKENDK